MNRYDIARRVSQISDIPIHTADDVSAAVFQAISECLISGQSVQIRGFGTFSVVERAARQGRAVKSGETVQIPPRTVPVFKPSAGLKEMVGNK